MTSDSGTQAASISWSKDWIFHNRFVECNVRNPLGTVKKPLIVATVNGHCLGCAQVSRRCLKTNDKNICGGVLRKDLPRGLLSFGVFRFRKEAQKLRNFENH